MFDGGNLLAPVVRRHRGGADMLLAHRVDAALLVGQVREPDRQSGVATDVVSVGTGERPQPLQPGVVGQPVHLLQRDFEPAFADPLARPPREADMRVIVALVALVVGLVDRGDIGEAKPAERALAIALDHRVTLLGRQPVRQVPDDAVLHGSVGSIALLSQLQRPPAGGDLFRRRAHVRNWPEPGDDLAILQRLLAQDIERVIGAET